MTPWEPAARRLYESDPTITMAQIAAAVGTTKNAVVGMAHRRGWRRAGDRDHRPLIYARLDALAARMDAVLAATEGVGRVIDPAPSSA